MSNSAPDRANIYTICIYVDWAHKEGLHAPKNIIFSKYIVQSLLPSYYGQNRFELFLKSVP